MLNVRVVQKQTARSSIWVNFTLAIFITVFALILTPFLHENLTLWGVGISLVSYIFIHFGFALRTKIVEDDKSNCTLVIPDHSSNTNQRIPFEFITGVELCSFRPFEKERYIPEAICKNHYYTKTLFGYVGPGLIICYRLSEPVAEEAKVRGIKFPAPKAKEFMSMINSAIMK